jgi:hypothetical protein
MAVGANANAYWLISFLNATLSGAHQRRPPGPLSRFARFVGSSLYAPKPPAPPLLQRRSSTRRSIAGSIGSAEAAVAAVSANKPAARAAKGAFIPVPISARARLLAAWENSQEVLRPRAEIA